MNRRGVRYFREEPERVAVGSRMPEDDEANDEMSTELEGLIRDVSRTAPVTPGSWRHFLGGLLALGAWPLCSMLGAPDNIQAMAMMLSGVWAGYHIGLSTREDCVSAWANYARYLRRELGTLDRPEQPEPGQVGSRMPEPTNEDLISTLRRRLAEALMRPLTRGPESAELHARLAAHYARALAAMTGASEESHETEGAHDPGTE